MKRLLFFVLGLFLAQAPHLSASSPVVISEIMADNTRTLQDEDGDSEDWIEIRNVGSNAVSLRDWALTDDAGDLTKWRFPATNLNVGAYMVIFASDKDRRVPGRPLHTNFR
ncbi:MAG TPA: lamin tail domain-containing protein, partial [Blastocatellia bacterium]|nr:lamin tail domain-containing protein [Blastocatellia bacterium]